MKTNIVYILTSSDSDVYYEETLISAWSARYWNPTANIILVTEDKTDLRLKNDCELMSIISEKIVVSMPSEWNQQKRSRELKTTLRKLVSGDYLYIDTDTVVCSAMDEVDSIKDDMSAVLDCHHTYSSAIHFVSARLSLLGAFAEEGDRYFNSGVMYVKDNAATHEFYDLWHNLYQESLNKGFCVDQPSLFVANQRYNLIKELWGGYNCQIFCGGLPWLADAKIVHAFNGVQSWGHGNPKKDQKYDPVKSYAFYRPADTNFLLKIKEQGKLFDEDKQVIMTAKSQFYGEYQLMFGQNLEFYHSALYHVFSRSKRLFKFLELLGKVYLRITK